VNGGPAASIKQMISREQFISGAAVAAASQGAAATERPNIVLILADDLGYGDIGCFGAAQYRTPNLDRLAAEGARLTSHYVCAPVCSPSRAGLLTGRYPQRTGVTGVLRDQDDQTGLALGEQTVADLFSRAGYETFLIGKWHLGVPPEYWPRRRGFQYFYGFLSGSIDYNTHLSLGGGAKGRRATYRNEMRIEEEGYLPDLLHQEAVRVIEQRRPRPFFLFLSHPLPHTPLQAPDRWVSGYRHLGGKKAIYAGMIACLDDGVGQVMRALDRMRLREQTMVVFFSDNGASKLAMHADVRDAASNGPFRGGKYELTDGGLRSPCMVRWPRRVPAGASIDTPVTNLDWLPTFRDAAGIAEAATHPLDGVSLLPLLTARKPPAERTLFWTFEDQLVRTPRSWAARTGPWKYLRVGDKEMLFDVQLDPGESKDLSALHPELVTRFRSRILAWQDAVR
jgi:arylsulfatase A-like enzyme